jgi:hypothetical protein
MIKATLYGIENIISGQRVYTGVTVLTVRHRMSLHKTARTYFGRAMREQGVENFRIIPLAIGEDRYLYDIEPKAIRRFNTLEPHGYNKIAAAFGRRRKITGGPPRVMFCISCGTQKSVNQRPQCVPCRIAADRGSKRSPQACANIRASRIYECGKKLTAAQRLKISLATKGVKKKPRTLEHTRKIVESYKRNRLEKRSK